MYNGIGLQTPRGSGTNGHIQTNKFNMKPRNAPVRVDYTAGVGDGSKPEDSIRMPNKEIIEHDRKRQIEIRLLVLQEELEELGYSAAEMTEMLANARKKYEEEFAEAAALEACGGGGMGRPPIPNQRFSDTQTHHSAARKEILSANFKEILDGARPRQRYHIREDGPRKLTSDGGTDELKHDEIDDKGKHTSNRNANFVEVGINRHEKSRGSHDSESKTDSRSRKKSTNEVSKNHKGVKMVEAYSDDSSSDSGEGTKKTASAAKHAKKHRRHDTDSDSDSEDKKHKDHVKKQVRKSRRHSSTSESESSESETSESDASESDFEDQKKSRKGLEKRSHSSGTYDASKHDKRKRHDLGSSKDDHRDDDNDNRSRRNSMDKYSKKHKNNVSGTSELEKDDKREDESALQKPRSHRASYKSNALGNRSPPVNHETSRRHDSEDSEDDADCDKISLQRMDKDRDSDERKTQKQKEKQRYLIDQQREREKDRDLDDRWRNRNNMDKHIDDRIESWRGVHDDRRNEENLERQKNPDGRREHRDHDDDRRNIEKLQKHRYETNEWRIREKKEKHGNKRHRARDNGTDSEEEYAARKRHERSSRRHD